MSHNSGFRPKDHDSTHRSTKPQRSGSKAFRAFEERFSRRYSEHERARRAAIDKEA
jgi:hypothetical protein